MRYKKVANICIICGKDIHEVRDDEGKITEGYCDCGHGKGD